MKKIKIDTEKLSVSIGDTQIANQVKKISFDWAAGKEPEIKIELDGDVTLEGTLLKKSVAKVICPNCGKILGEMAGSYDIDCPKCGHNCFRL